MRRKVSNLDFALVWGKVSRWPDREWADLVDLRAGLSAAKAEDTKQRRTPKPKGEKAAGGAS